MTMLAIHSVQKLELVEIGEKLVETGMNVLFCSREVHPLSSTPCKQRIIQLEVRRSDMKDLIQRSKNCHEH